MAAELAKRANTSLRGRQFESRCNNCCRSGMKFFIRLGVLNRREVSEFVCASMSV